MLIRGNGKNPSSWTAHMGTPFKPKKKTMYFLLTPKTILAGIPISSYGPTLIVKSYAAIFNDRTMALMPFIFSHSQNIRKGFANHSSAGFEIKLEANYESNSLRWTKSEYTHSQLLRT